MINREDFFKHVHVSCLLYFFVLLLELSLFSDIIMRRRER